jgi:hypothetical protein
MSSLHDDSCPPKFSSTSKGIFMKIPKLDRQNSHEINANPPDRLSLWPSPFYEDRQNLILEHGDGNRILAIYGITHAQLSNIYDEIGSVLGKAWFGL